MTTLVTGDLHLSANPRDAYRFAAMEQLAEIIEKRKVNTLIIVGDLTEAKDFHPAELVNDVVEVVYNLGCLVEELIIGTGNHDYTNAECPFFHFMRRLRKVKWINKPQQLQFDGLSGFFLPHTYNYVRDWKVDEFSWQKVNWIFAHNTFEGASTEHGKRLHGIPLSVFPSPSKVISGDIHMPQTIGDKIKVTYVGAPYTVDFNDDFEPRVILIDGMSFTSIPVPGPQKRLVELKAGFKLGDVNANKGDIVKVRYRLTQQERERWPEIKASLRLKLSEVGLIVHMIQPELDKMKSVIVKKRSSSKKDDLELVKEFSKRSSISDKILQAGMDIVEKD